MENRRWKEFASSSFGAWLDGAKISADLNSCPFVSISGCIMVLLAFLTSGCMAKNKADAQARAAFFAGQRQAVEMVQRAQAMGPTVTILGPVRNPTIPWTNELTLAKALIAADYFGRTDPSEILVVRNGQATTHDPKKLLNGEDVPLQPRDIIEIRQ